MKRLPIALVLVPDECKWYAKPGIVVDVDHTQLTAVPARAWGTQFPMPSAEIDDVVILMPRHGESLFGGTLFWQDTTARIPTYSGAVGSNPKVY